MTTAAASRVAVKRRYVSLPIYARAEPRTCYSEVVQTPITAYNMYQLPAMLSIPHHEGRNGEKHEYRRPCEVDVGARVAPQTSGGVEEVFV